MLQLSEEAAKWAATYRSQIPMVTLPQMARRNDTERSRRTQTDPGDVVQSRTLQDSLDEHLDVDQMQIYNRVYNLEDEDDSEVHSDGATFLPCTWTMRWATTGWLVQI